MLRLKGIKMAVFKTDYVQGSLFEDDYLIRTLGALSHKPDVALTELVATLGMPVRPA